MSGKRRSLQKSLVVNKSGLSLFQIALVATALLVAVNSKTVELRLREEDGGDSVLTQSYRLSENSRVRVELMPDRLAYRDKEHGLRI